MLLQKKSLTFIARSGEKYLIFMLLKMRKLCLSHLPKIIKIL